MSRIEKDTFIETDVQGQSYSKIISGCNQNFDIEYASNYKSDSTLLKLCYLFCF